MSPMSPAFFLCYRREYAGYATALSAALTQRYGRRRVFMDITALPLAQNWREVVAAKLDRSTHVLALVGPQWMDGVGINGRRDGQLDPVVFELTRAFKRELTVLPVLLDGQRLPEARTLPPVLRRFAELNAAHIRSESADHDIAQLVRRLPNPWLGRIIAAVVLVLAVLLWFLVPGPPETRHTNVVVTKSTDPCSFVSTDDLAEFGHVQLMPEYGYFAGCTATIQAGGETPVDVRIELDVPQYSGQTFAGTVETRGKLVIAREPCVDECRTTLQMADGPRVVLQVRDGDASLRQKVAGRATETATRVLEARPLSERPPFPEHSMGRVMACDLLTADEIRPRVDVPEPKQTPGFGDWTCAWGKRPTTVIGIGYDRVTPNEIRAEGSEQLAARKVYVVSRIEPDGRRACQVNIPGIGFTSRTDDPRVEVVQLLVRGADSRSVEQMCSYARALAEVVVPRLPR